MRTKARFMVPVLVRRGVNLPENLTVPPVPGISAKAVDSDTIRISVTSDYPSEVQVSEDGSTWADLTTLGANPPDYDHDIEASTLGDSLVSWWSMDETTGDRVDSHGSNDLDAGGGVGAGSLVQGGAADLESSSGERLENSSPSGLPTGSFSVAGWVQPESWPHQYCPIFFVGEGTGVHAHLTTCHLFYESSAGRLEWWVYFSSTWVKVNGPAVSLGSPTFIYAHYDADNDEISLSVNNGTAVTTALASTPNAPASPSLRFGFQGSAFGTRQWDGLLDEFGFWGRTLSASEITELYNLGSGIAYPGPPSTPPYTRHYRARAVNGGIYSDWSATATETTPTP